jgi:beta propeller repeat protein
MKHLFSRTSSLALATLFGVAAAGCQDETLPTLSSPEAARPGFALFADGAEVQVTTNTSLQFHPAVHGTRIVYADGRNGNYDVYTFDLSTGVETRLTTGTATQQHPAVSDSFVVYGDWSTPTVEIRAVDLLTGADFQITPSDGKGSESVPSLSGHRVVYGSNRADNHDIFLYDLRTRQEVPLRTELKASSTDADIGGDLVVWAENWGGGDDPDIMLHDLNSGATTQIPSGPAWQGRPATDGAKVVYEDNRNGNTEIYLYDPATQTERRITSNAADQRNPDISGNLVVWEDYRHGNAEIYALDLATGVEHRITSNWANQVQPSVSGNRIVWHDGRKGNADIYLYSPQGR